MNKKKITFLGLMMLAVGLIITGCTNESEDSDNGDKEEVIAFDVGHTLSPGSPRDETVLKFKEVLEEKSDGQMTINNFPQSQLGGEVEMQEAVQSGNQDIAFTSSSTLANISEEFSILDLPYLFDDLEQANSILRSEPGDLLLDKLSDLDMVGLGYAETVDRNVFANEAIEKAEDMAGLKIRIIEAPGYVETFKALDAQPTPMAYSELYTSLQQGVVDGGDTSADQFVMDKFVEVSDHFSLTGMNYIAIVGIMSESAWEDLTSEQQKIVQEAFDEASEFAPKEFDEQIEEYLQEMEDEGVNIIEPDIDSFKEATEDVSAKLIEDIPNGQELYDSIQQAKEEAK